jgi:hypothetical protein
VTPSQIIVMSIIGGVLTLAGTIGAAWISYRGSRRAGAVTEQIESGRLWREDVEALRRQRMEDQLACEEAINKYKSIVADLMQNRGSL